MVCSPWGGQACTWLQLWGSAGSTLLTVAEQAAEPECRVSVLAEFLPSSVQG